MNWLDIVIIVIIALAVFKGIHKGLISQVCSLLGIIFGVIIASRNYVSLGITISRYTHHVNISNILSYIIIFSIIILIFSVIGTILTKIIGALPGLGMLNSLLGGIIGFLEAGFVIGIVLILLTKYPVLGLDDVVMKSRLSPFFSKLIKTIPGILPPEFTKEIQGLSDKIKGMVPSVPKIPVNK